MKKASSEVWGVAHEHNVSLRMAAYMIAIHRVAVAAKDGGMPEAMDYNTGILKI